MFGKVLAGLVLVTMVAASTALACPPQVLMALSQPVVSQQVVSQQVMQQQEQVTQSTVMVPQTVESTVMVPQTVQQTVMVPQTTTTVTSVPVVVPSVQTFSASGTWTKPATGTRVIVELWGGGGSGLRNAATGN